MSRSSRFRAALLGLSLPAVLGCGETTVEVTLRSLQASSEVTFVCRAADGTGLERDDCPDYENFGNRLFALVTQVTTAEVAVIDVNDARVVDLDPSAPGYAFLRLPSRPGHLATSPGGAASFVGLAGVGATGLAALPTSCIGAPRSGETARDVTGLSACQLSSAPGDMVVLVAPPDANGASSASCGAAGGDEGAPPGATRSECRADLTTENGPPGRRKLAVALPDEGRIVVVDAQWLVDRPAGTFERCRIEATLDLAVDLGSSGVAQVVPPELDVPGCSPSLPVAPPVPPSYLPRPSGFALDASRLYVSDQGAPVVHVLDVSDPCDLRELPSLVPRSYERPNRSDITTSGVAVSPLTPSGKRFVYAIDEFDSPAASLMVFDVSPGSSDRTPILRSGSSRIADSPDRIQFSSPVADVTFALRDLPIGAPETGIAAEGVLCDPDPGLDPSSPAALYRPSSDTTRGAQPFLLRGLFGLVLLESGQVAVIDVEDFDAPCRRPAALNPFPTEDFRGCSSDDPALGDFLTLNGQSDGQPTVTNEVSCSVVAPHRLRSATFSLSSSSTGLGAPSLTSLPAFTAADQATDVEPLDRPKLLAVDFPNPDPDGEPLPPELYVGTRRLSKDAPGSELATDPNVVSPSGMALPWNEPRSYPSTEVVTLTYEGHIVGNLPSGVLGLDVSSDPPATVFDDPSGFYCDRGVYDELMMRELGADELGITDAARLNAFAATHADLVQVTQPLLSVEDSYWRSSRAEACGGFAVCSDTFGPHDSEVLSLNRELNVREAYQNRLVVTPRGAQTPDESARLAELFECCFPEGVRYTIRAANQWVLAGGSSGVRHDVVARAETRDGVTVYPCRRDCNPRRRFERGRVFEIASDPGCDDQCAVGPARPGDPCVYDPLDGPTPRGITLDDPAAACIHEGLTARFAVYRGRAPSLRDMAFSWQVSGGFRGLFATLTSISNAVSPQSIVYEPRLESFFVVDGATLGLARFYLDTLRVERPWPVY